MVYPEGIMYNKQNGVVRTSKVNLIFNEIPLLVSLCAEKEKGDSIKNRLKSNYVLFGGLSSAQIEVELRKLKVSVSNI